MSLEPKHMNFKNEYKIKELVLKKCNIRRHMSILVAFEWHYLQELLNWWHSTFNKNTKTLCDVNLNSPRYSDLMTVLLCDLRDFLLKRKDILF